MTLKNNTNLRLSLEETLESLTWAQPGEAAVRVHWCLISARALTQIVALIHADPHWRRA